MASPQSLPLSVVVSAATAGSTELAPAVAGKRIRVLAFLLVAAGTVTAALASDAEGSDETPLTGDMPMAAQSQLTGSFHPLGWCETDVGSALMLVLSGNVAVEGVLTYTLV